MEPARKQEVLCLQPGKIDPHACPTPAEVLAGFCAAYPKLELSIDMLSMDELISEVAEARAHIGLAFNPPPHAQVAWLVSSPQPVVLLVHPTHALAQIGRAAAINDLSNYPLALMPATFGIGKAIEMLSLAENIEIRPTLTTNSLTALKRAAATGRRGKARVRCG